jgi:prolipoprotein diacylglyceryltransferase
VGFLILTFVFIGAGLRGQIIEGSPKLLRSCSYYGGLTGGIIASLLAHFVFSIDFFILLASFAMAAPWIQATGRLRCLVQAGLSGVPMHPTQLYSIGTNIITGLILIRLFNIGISSSFIVGIYLILNGTGRFVGESFRGEAQTPYWEGMSIYQWIAILNILFGIIFTAIPNRATLVFQPNLLSLILAIGMGILVTIASGVDFPKSKQRLAHLTSN